MKFPVRWQPLPELTSPQRQIKHTFVRFPGTPSLAPFDEFQSSLQPCSLVSSYRDVHAVLAIQIPKCAEAETPHMKVNAPKSLQAA